LRTALTAYCGCKVLDVSLDSLSVAKCNRSITSGRLPAWIALDRQTPVLPGLGSPPNLHESVAGAAKPRKAILDVGCITRLRHFPVIYDIDAGLFLFSHDPGHGVAILAANSARSTACPSSLAYIIRTSSSGRGRLPVCVVRKRSLLRTMG
jgi:hypothetical protein